MPASVNDSTSPEKPSERPCLEMKCFSILDMFFLNVFSRQRRSRHVCYGKFLPNRSAIFIAPAPKGPAAPAAFAQDTIIEPTALRLMFGFVWGWLIDEAKWF